MESDKGECEVVLLHTSVILLRTSPDAALRPAFVSPRRAQLLSGAAAGL